MDIMPAHKLPSTTRSPNSNPGLIHSLSRATLAAIAVVGAAAIPAVLGFLGPIQPTTGAPLAGLGATPNPGFALLTANHVWAASISAGLVALLLTLIAARRTAVLALMTLVLLGAALESVRQASHSAPAPAAATVAILR
ncbi:MAG: hypothetical protein KF745_01265 [Phycisphaeraceae bacterium]|nr:hypothetical protein [Phycisphaeraceae bacterium]